MFEPERLVYVCYSVFYVLTSSVQFSPSLTSTVLPGRQGASGWLSGTQAGQGQQDRRPGCQLEGVGGELSQLRLLLRGRRVHCWYTLVGEGGWYKWGPPTAQSGVPALGSRRGSARSEYM